MTPWTHIPLTETQTLENVDIWNASGVLTNQTVVVSQGKIQKITPSTSKGSSINKVLIPAGVDPQVHLRVPGQAEKETAQTGLLAALHGGTGALLTMPNTRPVIDNVDVLIQARKETEPFEKEYGVHVEFSAAVTMSQQGKTLVNFEALAKAGIAAFTDDGLGVESDELMDEAFAELAKVGKPLLQHAEFKGAKGPLAPGPVQRKLGLEPYDEKLEVDMIERDLRVLERNPKAHYHVLHLSSARSLDVIQAARSKGLNVTCEVTPHHLLFSSDDIEENNKSYKMNPPIRGEKDKLGLQLGLQNGLIDWVATDHAPHEATSKEKEFKLATFGTVGLETNLQTLLRLSAEGHLTPNRLVDVFSTRPAAFLGLQNEYGVIAEGRPTRFLLVDVQYQYKMSESDLWSKNKNSCFLGHTLYGRIEAHWTRAGSFWF